MYVYKTTVWLQIKYIFSYLILSYLIKDVILPVAYRGGAGGHGPRAQALEGAPAQLVRANFKSRGEFQPSKSSIYAMGPTLPMH